MEESIDFPDWELLHGPDAAPVSPAALGEAIEADSDEGGAIKPDYFALGSEDKYPARSGSAMAKNREEEEELGLCDSDNPSWVDPESDHRKGESGFSRISFPQKNPGAFWSDESSDELRSPPSSERRELSFLDEFDVEEKAVDVEVGKEIGRDEVARKVFDEMGSKKIGSVAKREEGGMVWWKVPLELLKFCVFRMRPAWSISAAAVILGFAVLGRRLYKMKQMKRSIPQLKISLDEKKASQFKARVARLNEAFSVVRRVPLIRAPLPASGVTPWPVVGFQ
ncbi:hypothetical protein ACMD2_06592 [Ananas comosus]|uniref:DUF6821 domain-containing protein n=1 Tax=Ananas comosus TaxID=4615 RepID=A0A199W2W7_ANACO|nr:hypothetical protein ACMD2_06592 [Ananas comosus]